MLPAPFNPTNSVQHYIDSDTNRVVYRVVSPTGLIAAEGIDSENLARRIACMDELFDAFEYLLEYVETAFWQNRYDLKWCMANYEELAAGQDGVYEKEQPGLPEQAEILVELTDLREHLKTPKYRLIKPTTPGEVPFIVGG